jgi:hypothetical protein
MILLPGHWIAGSRILAAVNCKDGSDGRAWWIMLSSLQVVVQIEILICGDSHPVRD